MAANITDITMQNASAFFGKLATTNYFQVVIGGFKEDFKTKLQYAEWGPKIDWNVFGESLGLLCTDATLPSSTYATAEVKDNYMGVPQEFAHTRLYTDIDFTFYVDGEYQIQGFFEFWMNYIGGAAEVAASSPDNLSRNVFRRLVYPDNYKTDSFYIVKFDRNYKTPGAKRLVYQLVNAFPKAVTSVPVSYGPSELMKVTITMNYDRYVVSRLTTDKLPSPPPGSTSQPPGPGSSSKTAEQPQKPALTERGRLIINGQSVYSRDPFRRGTN